MFALSRVLISLCLISLGLGLNTSSWQIPDTALAIEKTFSNWRQTQQPIRTNLKNNLARQPNLQSKLSDKAGDLKYLNKDLIRQEALKVNFLAFESDGTFQLLGQTFTFDFKDQELIHELVVNEVLKDLDDDLLKTGSIFSELVEQLLKVLMTALETEAKHLFTLLVQPLFKIAIMLDPLPEYQNDPQVLDGTEGPMKYIDQPMDNWGSTLHNNEPIRIFYPETR
jgi:hypothetical protein